MKINTLIGQAYVKKKKKKKEKEKGKKNNLR